MRTTEANAEDSASASEELNAQSEQMKGNVGARVALVRGTDRNRQTAETAAPKRFAQAVRKTLPAAMKRTKAISESAENEVKPEDIIPLHDSEFKDF